MDVEAKQNWVEALRSGKYKQGDGCLRDRSDRFCCLGVLCDILKKEGEEWRPDPENTASQFEFSSVGQLPVVSFPPENLIDRVGLEKDQPQELADMNDSGASFEEIADWIEEHL